MLALECAMDELAQATGIDPEYTGNGLLLILQAWLLARSVDAVVFHAAGGQTATMFIGIAFSEALGIFSFLVALLLMFAV